MEISNNEEIVTDTIDFGTIENVQIAPLGSFKGSDVEGNPVDENIDEDALRSIADSLNASGKEVVADVDHGIARPGVQKDSRAAGWFSEFFVEPLRGLFAKLRLTRHGKELLESREYRFISPQFALDESGKPVELQAASLTNAPAFGDSIAPILNSEPAEQDNSTKGLENMSKDELKALLKEVILEIKAEKEVAENAEPEKTEEPVEEQQPETSAEEKPACNEEPEKEEKPAEEEQQPETSAEEKPAEKQQPQASAEEPEKKEEKEEVIKLESLNSAPHVKLEASEEWRSLNGAAFWSWLDAHPEALKR